MYREYSHQMQDTMCVWTISAGDHPFAPRLLRDLQEYNLNDHVHNLGPLTHKQVQDLFFAADLMVFPTKLETFGIPFVEAMTSGVPIVTSDYDFTRCVCGDAAEYAADPDCPHAWYRALRNVLDSPGRWEQLHQLGVARRASFPPWPSTIARILDEEGIERNLLG